MSLFLDSRLQRAARIAFGLAAIFAFIMAVLPHPPRIPGQPSDKILHVAAFATLGILAAAGFRGRSVWWLFATLTAFGALIEAVQAIPMLNRDSELMDLLADMAAALVALALVRFVAAKADPARRADR